MTFRLVATIGAVVYGILFALFLFTPALYPATYGVDAGTGGTFMTRRSAGMMLGLGLLVWFARNEPPSKLRSLIASVQTVVFVTVAVTGVQAYLSNVADARILLAALGELSLAAAFWVTRNKP